jgi:hypothetical protein
MNPINKWKEFEVKKIFSFERGKRLITADHIAGDIAYISSTKKNNGIDNYITPPGFMTIYRNAITLNNSGSVGYCFYHPYKFVASDHCTVITLKDPKVEMNQYIALFVKPVIEAMKVKYNFAREISDERLAKEKVNLPAGRNGEPDWLYMKRFIIEKASEIVFDKQYARKKTRQELNPTSWQDFKLSDIFDIKKGKRLTVEDFVEGSTPFIGAIDANNGYRDFIGQQPIHPGNVITVTYNGSVAEAFYQPKSFWASDDVNVLYPKFTLNTLNALFICSIIRKEKFRFNYGRKWNLERMNESIIKLPVAANRKPDYDYMESFMKNLSYADQIV